MKIQFISILFILNQIIFSFPSYSQENDSTKSYFIEASYFGDNINNISGGIKTGSCYLGIAAMGFGFDTEKSGLWKGGSFYIYASNTHGAIPSSDYIGDMQVASNIEAGNHTYVQELWVKQLLGKFELTAGLQDLNVEFSNSEYGYIYLNSSLGIMPLISNNITAPIFPLTTLGLTGKWKISEKITGLLALYDGCPTDFEDNPHNFKWKFVSGDGLLGITEFQYATKAGIYKIGAYSHNHYIERSLKKDIPDSINYNIFGLYSNIDQKIWQNGNKGLGLFIQLGYSPTEASLNDFYFGLGINYSGLLSKKGNDILGLAVAHEHFSNELKSETALELTYQYHINNHIYIQPDFQYIFNPAGTGINLTNSFLANFRFGIIL